MYKIKKGLILIMITVLFSTSSGLEVNANSIENARLDKIMQAEELRVSEINSLYNQKQELYSEYYESKDLSILSQIEIIEAKLAKLGVMDYTWDEMNSKVNNMEINSTKDLVNPNAVIPPNTSNVKWSTYRYSSVIWGRLHEMQVVMAEPIGSGGPLSNTTASVQSKITYNNAIHAAALTVFDIFKGDLSSLIVYKGIPVGTIVKNLYDIATEGYYAMSPTTTFDSILYNTTAHSVNTMKYGFIKVNGQPDYEQKFVYMGNRVHMTYTFSMGVDYYNNNGEYVSDVITHKEQVYHESDSYNNIVLNVTQNPNNTKSYVIYSKNAYLNYLPYRFFNSTHYHYVPGISYVEHGLSMYNNYIFYY